MRVGQKIVGQVELPQQPIQAKTQNWSVGYAWVDRKCPGWLKNLYLIYP